VIGLFKGFGIAITTALALARLLSVTHAQTSLDLEIERELKPAVVFIQTKVEWGGFSLETVLEEYSPLKADQLSGSGFIFRKDGYILTNRHVVDPIYYITKRLEGEKAKDRVINDFSKLSSEPELRTQVRTSIKVSTGQRYRDGGEPFEAEVFKFDENEDLAVLKIKTNRDSDQIGFPTLALGDSSDLGYTDQVNVLGFLDGKFNSSLGTIKDAEDKLIDFNTPIDKGFSGGPMIKSGRVVGVITSIARRGGFVVSNKAIRVNYLRFFLEEVAGIDVPSGIKLSITHNSSSLILPQWRIYLDGKEKQVGGLEEGKPLWIETEKGVHRIRVTNTILNIPFLPPSTEHEEEVKIDFGEVKSVEAKPREAAWKATSKWEFLAAGVGCGIGAISSIIVANDIASQKKDTRFANGITAGLLVTSAVLLTYDLLLWLF
jgi:S1-C subfamily serine protease